MNNIKLARFITSLGSLNGYASTVAQTKRALDSGSSKPLNQDNDDVAIFEDALSGIKAIKKIGFSVDGIIAINKNFDSPSPEEPDLPGHLRNENYNPDDAIAIATAPNSSVNDYYRPPAVVTRQDLQKVIDVFNESAKLEKDAWQVFASLSKLQPFQDGNKRTALIAANAAFNTWEKENYLTLPFNDLDRAEFTISLMRYYQAKDNEQEELALERMLSLLPTDKERIAHLKEPLTESEKQRQSISPTIRVKEEFRSNKK
jgi:hypothetical protein